MHLPELCIDFASLPQSGCIIIAFWIRWWWWKLGNGRPHLQSSSTLSADCPNVMATIYTGEQHCTSAHCCWQWQRQKLAGTKAVSVVCESVSQSNFCDLLAKWCWMLLLLLAVLNGNLILKVLLTGAWACFSSAHAAVVAIAVAVAAAGPLSLSHLPIQLTVFLSPPSLFQWVCSLTNCKRQLAAVGSTKVAHHMAVIRSVVQEDVSQCWKSAYRHERPKVTAAVDADDCHLLRPAHFTSALLLLPFSFVWWQQQQRKQR